MSVPFGELYAQTYDDVYRAKDYGAECDLLELVWRQHASGPVRTVLDLGCGTGGHALVLAQRGYEVVGVDRSPSMLARADEKAKAIEGAIGTTSFVLGDVRESRLERTFDAVAILFAVLGYQTTNDDVLAALGTAREHLPSGGMLVFDVWYGPAVLHERPEQRIAVVDTPTGRLLRVTGGSLDVSRHLSRVAYRLWELAGDRVVAETEEEHVMRFFFPLELELFLDVCGFDLLRLGAFPEIEVDPDEGTWNVAVVARAR
jgi:SAM-dependent methyltransferase